MAVPDYQSLMLPLLKILGDGKDHKRGDVTEQLAEQFKLSDEDRHELLPSGKQSRFDNRVGWCRTYLGKALLLEKPSQGILRITERGATVLKAKPEKIDAHFLRQFEEFKEFTSVSKPGPTGNGEDEGETPEELLETSYQKLREALVHELVAKIKTCSPHFFERLVVELLVKMGYGGSRKDAGQAVGQSGDGGIDGIIKEDKLGLDAVYIQAKRWEATVGRPAVQTFSGSLDGPRARKGVFITTSNFSAEARDYVAHIDKKIVLVDGEQLANLMIDHGLGVADVASYSVKKLDLDYFDEEV